ncbi:MAG: NADH-quinone oxidoreductase subunit C [Thermoplasmatota archaeon]
MSEEQVPVESAALSADGDLGDLIAQHPDAFTAVETTNDGVQVATVAADQLFTVARTVKKMGYPLLSLISAYDTPKGGPVGVLYAFVKLAETPAEFGELRLRVVLPKTDEDGNELPRVTQSLCDLYAAAGWHEREMWDLYGITFEGNPDHRRIFLPEGWKGHPGLKDDKEPEQFVALRDGEDIVLSTNEEGSW